ncbi:MAG: hypothetical protein LBJ83_01605 [Oscillospiraceae bacterium]|nr:hypothetical protein [Oscillospiraceae bacterium]
MKIEKLLEQLCNLICTPGEELKEQKLEAILKPYGKAQKDNLGNTILKKNASNKALNRVLLDAHIDEVGAIVTNITKDGFLKVDSCGSVDPKVFFGAEVLVVGKKQLPGVACQTPPHLQTTNKTCVPEITNSYIDIGYNFEHAKDFVPLGSRVILQSVFLKLKNHIYSGRAMDNRAGCASVICALEILKNTSLKNTEINAVFSAMEEVGCRALPCAVSKLKPTHTIIIDATFGTTKSEDSELMQLGKGPALGISPGLNEKLKNLLAKQAENHNIPFQLEVCGGKTSTNADNLMNHKKPMLISIPLKYMHSPVSCVNLKDIEATGFLVAKFIQNLDLTVLEENINGRH